MGTSLVAGRDLTWTDIYNMNPVALISESMAREMWHDPTAALGKRVRVGTTDDWREIVGVVTNVYDDGLNKEPSEVAYWPLMMRNFEGDGVTATRNLAFVLRTPRAGTESLMKDVRQAVWSVDPNLPLAGVRTEEYYYRTSMARTSFTLLMLAVAGAMALLLGDRWHLWRDCVFRFAAHARDRHSHGAGRATPGADRNVRPAWAGSYRNWRGLWVGSCIALPCASFRLCSSA